MECAAQVKRGVRKIMITCVHGSGRLTKKSKQNFIVWIILLSFLIGLTFWFVHRVPRNYLLPPPQESFLNESFLVSNNKCQIAQLQIWDKQVLAIILKEKEKKFTCDKRLKIEGVVKGLTSVNNQLLLVNREALIPLGLNFNDIECCYQVVERVEQNDTSYNFDADFKHSFSPKCYPMKERSYPHAGFLKVTCNRKGNGTNQPVTKIHTDFHLLAIFPKDERNGSLLANKLIHWKDCKERGALAINGCGSSSPAGYPPNVLIILLDSTSRMHFRRMMKGTVDVLKKELGAVEMKGFTKVGKNTFPNIVPLLTSYSEAELTKYCWPNYTSPLDNCPFVWKNFSNQNYLTVFFEDSQYPTFNFNKLGFVRQPVDVYPRPWLRAAYEQNGYEKCFGYRRTDQVLLEYVRDFVGLAAARGIPYFVTAMLSDYTHDRMRQAALVDISLRDALLQMKGAGSLDNTMLIVMGDHGYRFLNIRQTFFGWFEDKLPAMWIKLPESLIKTQPTWQEALRFNSKQLITTFDIHASLINLLTGLNGSFNHVQTQELMSNKKASPGRTLFQRLPDRSCEDAGVSWEFCACAPPREFKGNESVLRQATLTALDELNSEIITSKCTVRFTIENVELIGVGIVSKVPLLPKQYELEYSRTGWIQEEHLFKGKSHLVLGLSYLKKFLQIEVLLAYNASSKEFHVFNRFLISSLNDFTNECIPTLGYTDKPKGYE